MWFDLPVLHAPTDKYCVDCANWIKDAKHDSCHIYPFTFIM